MNAQEGDAYFESYVAGFGQPLEAFFLIGGDRTNIAHWHPLRGLSNMWIEDDELREAFVEFLAKKKVRLFASEREALEAAFVEKWPGWEGCHLVPGQK